MISQNTIEAAKGKWRGVLLQLGLPEKTLNGKHGPCPMCGGKDRFRWDNKEGKGTYFCSGCGAGDGMKLAMEYTGKAFVDAARDIDGLLGNIKFDTKRPQAMSDDQRKNMLRDTYTATQPIEAGDAAHKYLESRGIDEIIYPDALRFAPSLRDGDGGIRPCLVAMVGVYGESKFVSMHRTFLASDGSGKADMQSPRKIMPGSLPDGSCVMLSDYESGPLGIAEGIETAMSASALYSMPVWAALSSNMLVKWMPPENCKDVVIFGDNDKKFGGQYAAYNLAHKLAIKGVNVTVEIPQQNGEDWADVYSRKG